MKYHFLFFLFFLFPSVSFSKHIIGGVLSYECLGGGTYHFTMKMYRDCYDPTGAFFDSPAPFTIFKGDVELTTLMVSVKSIEPVAPPPIPCLILPDNVCVEEGIYEFEYTFTDWPSTESYHISYMRCCRNATVVNIENPSDVGATFTIEILPASQEVCNSSPFFNTFPPIVICADEPLHYDHSALDTDGDQLVYSFCSPLLGGAPPGGGNGDPCEQVAPNPACPPPYAEAVFINPPYTEQAPMAGDPVVTIDPVTGLMTGTPHVLGQYVFAVCVSEYRNGELMSVIRRDFQFNVASCMALVNAGVEGPNVTFENGEYYYETCNGLEVFIENTSTTQQGTFDEWEWIFEAPDTVLQHDGWDLNMVFPSTGTYDGMLLLNPNDQLCGDTAIVHVEIFPEVVADFSYEYDTCVAGPVSFFDRSFIEDGGPIVSHLWNFGDGTTDTVSTNPVHVYGEPQTIPVSLKIRDVNGCSDSLIQEVVYFPIPEIIDVRPSDTLTCPPGTITFLNKSTPLDEQYEVNWDFGDGHTATALSPVHVYTEAGLYDVYMSILSPIGCFTDTVFRSVVRLTDPPLAAFDFDPKALSNLSPEVSFFDQSENAVRWDWFVNGNLVAQQPNFDYVFRDTGWQEVALVITHELFCQDTFIRLIDVEPKVTFYMPNAFTPNEDTNNDYFHGKGLLPGIQDFQMEIWDRWGNLLYVADAPDSGWNGQAGNTGKQVPTGVYLYVVRFTGPRETKHVYKGYVTVYR